MKRERNEGGQQTWHDDVHPSRLVDLNLNTEMAGNGSAGRTDRFAAERFRKTSAGRPVVTDGRRGRGGGWRVDRRDRRSEGDVRGWRGGDVRRGGGGERGRQQVEERGRQQLEERGRQQVEERGRQQVEERGRQQLEERGRQQVEEREDVFEEEGVVEVEGVGGRLGERGGRGRGGRREMEEEREQVEREDRVFREKRLMDSLTDPRDVPKGSWYFEVRSPHTYCL